MKMNQTQRSMVYQRMKVENKISQRELTISDLSSFDPMTLFHHSLEWAIALGTEKGESRTWHLMF
jgi:hypothetical protein